MVKYDNSMAGRIPHILLIASLLGCPLWCQQGVYACDGCAAVAADCCDSTKSCELEAGCHDPAADRGDAEAPGHSSNDPCDNCQCICGGAILANADLDLAANVAPAWEFVIQTVGIHVSRPQCDEPDRCLVVSGQFIRCLHSSYLL